MKPTRKLFKLVFPDNSELHGLEITCRKSTLGERREYLEKMQQVQEETLSPLGSLKYQIEFFLRFVTDWNLEGDDGEVLPFTYESMEELDFDWIKPILSAWMENSLGQKVKDSTEKKSGPGDSTETTLRTEESIPMEALP